jgi:NAD(P)-dependent dehydrogenase (short-subunit alcohol dehydrogenase family)
MGTNSFLVNNANGRTDPMPLQATEEELQGAFSINVFGTIFMMQAVVDHMPRGGRIIGISSVAVKLGLEFFPLYVASKAASDALNFSMAAEVSGIWGVLQELCIDYR